MTIWETEVNHFSNVSTIITFIVFSMLLQHSCFYLFVYFFYFFPCCVCVCVCDRSVLLKHLLSFSWKETCWFRLSVFIQTHSEVKTLYSLCSNIFLSVRFTGWVSASVALSMIMMLICCAPPMCASKSRRSTAPLIYMCSVWVIFLSLGRWFFIDSFTWDARPCGLQAEVEDKVSGVLP